MKTYEESLAFIKEVAAENGMRNANSATLEQLSNFLNRLESVLKIVKQSKPKAGQFTQDVRKHRKNQKIHFKRRFLERVGYISTDEKYDELCDLVKRDGKFLSKREGSDQSTFLVNYNGLNLKVVYNAYKNILITVLS